MSPSLRLCARAVAGLIRAALPQVSLVIGSGASCIQPLLANRPSHVEAPGTKATSTPLVDAFGSAAIAAATFFASAETFTASAGFADAITPSCSALRQTCSLSLSLPGHCANQ